MGSLLLNLLLSLLLWLRLNFRRVSAEHFIVFRRVPGQFLSLPFSSTPAPLLMLMFLLLLTALLCSSLSSFGWVWISAEYPQSISLVSAECQGKFWASLHFFYYCIIFYIKAEFLRMPAANPWFSYVARAIWKLSSYKDARSESLCKGRFEFLKAF